MPDFRESRYARGQRAGRVRIRLAAVLLRDLGVLVAPEDLWTQDGAYRAAQWDLARWGTSEAYLTAEEAARRGVYPARFSLSSWDTMTECGQKGVCWVGGATDSNYREVSVKDAA